MYELLAGRYVEAVDLSTRGKEPVMDQLVERRNNWVRSTFSLSHSGIHIPCYSDLWVR